MLPLWKGLKSSGVDAMNPVTKEEFAEFEKALTEKITAQATSTHYPDLVEALVKSVTLDLSAAAIKRIKLDLDALHSTKLKEERAAAAKAKKGKAKGGSIRMDTDKVGHSWVNQDCGRTVRNTTSLFLAGYLLCQRRRTRVRRHGRLHVIQPRIKQL